MNRFDEPIFLGGLAHSGKTQLRLVLDEIPTLSFTRRTKLWNRIYQRFGPLDDIANLDRCLDAMAANDGVIALEPDLAALRVEFLRGQQSYERLIRLFHQHVAERRNKCRWGDQSKFIERYGSVILDAFPGARMIHMVRDPRRTRPVRSGAAIRNQVSLGLDTARWIASMEAAQANQAKDERRYLVVRYEDFVADPADVVRTVCRFIDEDVPASVDEVLSSIRFEGAGGQNTRWETQTQRSSDRFVSMYAADLLDEYGYPRTTTLSTPAEHARFGATWPARRASMATWHMLDKRTTR